MWVIGCLEVEVGSGGGRVACLEPYIRGVRGRRYWVGGSGLNKGAGKCRGAWDRRVV